MKRREKEGQERWSAILRQVRAGLHDDLLPIYGSRGEIGIALWEQAYAHLCKFPGLAEETPNIDPGDDSQSPMNPSTNASKLARLAITAGLPHVRKTFGPSCDEEKQPPGQADTTDKNDDAPRLMDLDR